MKPTAKSPKNKFRASLTYGKSLSGIGSSSSFTANEIDYEHPNLTHHLDQAKRNKTTLRVEWFENKKQYPEFDWKFKETKMFS